jgi:hypothetical protein
MTLIKCFNLRGFGEAVNGNQFLKRNINTRKGKGKVKSEK